MKIGLLPSLFTTWCLGSVTIGPLKLFSKLLEILVVLLSGCNWVDEPFSPSPQPKKKKNKKLRELYFNVETKTLPTPVQWPWQTIYGKCFLWFILGGIVWYVMHGFFTLRPFVPFFLSFFFFGVFVFFGFGDCGILSWMQSCNHADKHGSMVKCCGRY